MPSSIRYEANLPDSRPAANRNLPLGSMLIARGTGSVGTRPMDVRWPVEASTEKQAMLSWPRFGAYRNFPDGVIWICAQLLVPL